MIRPMQYVLPILELQILSIITIVGIVCGVCAAKLLDFVNGRDS
jgi:hypothetical protein